MREEIRALSWKQPYASLMLHGKIETRTWSTKYRGKVLICASKQPYHENRVFEISGPHHLERILEMIYGPRQMQQPKGVAIAIGDLVECRPMTKDDGEKCFVRYNDGLWCHVYENVRPIKPFPWKGTQGWKILDDETISKIKLIEPPKT